MDHASIAGIFLRAVVACASNTISRRALPLTSN